jgi:hypothetical protein
MGVPYMVADMGGVSELVDLEPFSEAVLPELGAPHLAAQLQTVLERGTLPLLPLRPQARTTTALLSRQGALQRTLN